MMSDYLKNYRKLKLKFHKRTPKKSDETSDYNFSGIAYFIFQKETKGKDKGRWFLIKNFGELTNWDFRGKPNYKNQPGGKDYFGSKNNIDLVEKRFNSFPKLDYEYTKSNSFRKRREKLVKSDFKSLKEFNYIFKDKTLKTIDGFITGSHSSGGVKKPDADPLGHILIDNLEIEYNGSFYEFKRGADLNIFSLLCTTNRNGKNQTQLSLEEIDKVKEISLNEIDDLKLPFYPWGYKRIKEESLSFKVALIGQNYSNIVKKFKNKYIPPMYKPQDKRNIDEEIYNFSLMFKKWTSSQLKKESRKIWNDFVNRDIKNNKYENDFLYGNSKYDKAHIIENGKTIDKCIELSSMNDDRELLNWLKLLLNEKNYLLLPEEIHSAFDHGDLLIDYNKEFKYSRIPPRRIYEISDSNKKKFKEYFDTEREKLLHYRNSF